MDDEGFTRQQHNHAATPKQPSSAAPARTPSGGRLAEATCSLRPGHVPSLSPRSRSQCKARAAGRRRRHHQEGRSVPQRERPPRSTARRHKP